MNQMMPPPELPARSINPATGELIEEHGFASDAAVEQVLAAAAAAQKTWARTPLDERSVFLKRCAGLLRERRDSLAETITREMGKPLVEALGEVEKSAFNCEYVADHGAEWLADRDAPSNATQSYVSFLPLGVVFGVMPWNFPVWQIFRFTVSALMSGNAVILKHAPNVQGCAKLVERLIRDAGAPAGLFANLTASLRSVPAIVNDSRIAAVTLTGSRRAGSALAALAGAACKKSVLELGGLDPFIVLADADLDGAVAAAARGRFGNCGQVCIAPKRFILEESIADAFTERFVAAGEKLVIGDPMDRATTLGPMARGDLRDELHDIVEKTVAAGARVLTGGAPIEGPGNFFQPTVLDGVTSDMAAATRETFGPVASLMRVASADEAVAMANDSEFGLSSNLWTRDLDHGRALARRIEAGGVFINGVSASDPRLPVGGIKQSGYGRELAAFGMHEFTNIQTVWIGPVA